MKVGMVRSEIRHGFRRGDHGPWDGGKEYVGCTRWMAMAGSFLLSPFFSLAEVLAFLAVNEYMSTLPIPFLLLVPRRSNSFLDRHSPTASYFVNQGPSRFLNLSCAMDDDGQPVENASLSIYLLFTPRPAPPARPSSTRLSLSTRSGPRQPVVLPSLRRRDRPPSRRERDHLQPPPWSRSLSLPNEAFSPHVG